MAKETQTGNIAKILFGVILIVLGTLFLIGWIVPGLTIDKLWPMFMLIPVVFFIPALIEKGRAATGVLIPGTILVTLTVYFLVMNYTDWKLASATWPVYLLAPALGMFFFYLFNREQKGILVPVFMLTVLAVIFFGVSLNTHFVVAICFIAVGVMLILGALTKIKKKS